MNISRVYIIIYMYVYVNNGPSYHQYHHFKLENFQVYFILIYIWYLYDYFIVRV